MGVPRITSSVLAVFMVLMQDARIARYGLEIAAAAGLSHTTIYDVLARLEAVGWLTSEWEQMESRDGRRPRRRLYRLTAHGSTVAQDAIEAQYRTLSKVPRRGRWTPRLGESS